MTNVFEEYRAVARLPVKRVGDHDLPLPQRETEGSAGYDLRAARNYTIWPGSTLLIRTGFAWALPYEYVGLIRDRSGLAYRQSLTTRAGVIDADYRGEVMVLMRHEGEKGKSGPINIMKGERIAQMIITTYLHGMTQEVDDLADTYRGAGGFGSTGNV